MRLVSALCILTALLAIIIVPPLLSVGRYQGRITRLISASLGRPVRLSSVELRLLPRPGFVLTNLTVDEDPAYGAEPVLHANTVTASIRLVSLWRGLQISRISVDEASLNLVRTPGGRWNVESLFRSAASPANAANQIRDQRKVPLPYLEATNSRINIKDGAEKLPYSLVNADLSFWQDDPGHWRIRLRGQPARTDLSIDPADTGIVRLEADLHRAPELRQVPMHVDMEWSEAQLGQLTRLVAGSDAGWRGDLTGELHLDGTPDSAQIRVRLRAASVHRAEFVPAAPMDFDATCKFAYHYSRRALPGLECDSPIGDGRIHLSGGTGDQFAIPHFKVQLDRLPVEFVLEALRTTRSGFAAGLEVKGAISGGINYAQTPAAVPAVPHPAKGRNAHVRPTVQSPLTGSLTVQDFELSSDGMDQPIRLNKVVLEPALSGPGQVQLLTATASIPAGAPAPLTVISRIGFDGYQMSVRGQASIARIHELAQIAGLDKTGAFGSLTGGTAGVDLTASGPWIEPMLAPTIAPSAAIVQPGTVDGPDQVDGTLTLHDATWKADFLANPIQISQATLHAGSGQLSWNPVTFTYGPLKGNGSLTVPLRCGAPEGCRPRFELQFGVLDADSLEAAILGARESGTMLSELIARLSPSHSPTWPRLEGTVQAESLALGSVTLQKPSATLRILPDGAELTALDAGLFGGRIHSTGSVRAAGSTANRGSLPAYSLEAEFEHLNPTPLGQLLEMHWSGGDIQGHGNIDVSGYTGKDFATSASGTLHLEWRHGQVSSEPDSAASSPEGSKEPIPAALARFDHWTAEAAIARGAITLQANTVQVGARQSTIAGHVDLASPPELVFSATKPIESAHR